MKYIFSLCFLLSLITSAQTPVDNKKVAVVFKSVNVVPMDSERVLEKQDVVVKDGKILSITPTGKVKTERGALIVSAEGKYLIPGLAEMHAHITPNDNAQAHQEVLTLKQQLEQQAREKAQTQAEVEAQQQKLVALNGYIAILEEFASFLEKRQPTFQGN